MTNRTAADIIDLTARIRAVALARLTSGDTVVVGQRVDESREGRSGVVVGLAGGYGRAEVTGYACAANRRMIAA